MKVINQDQFTIVTELLDRQDKALEQIDELNLEVEKAIKELSDLRAVELEQEELALEASIAAVATNSADEAEESETDGPITLPIDIESSKAA